MKKRVFALTALLALVLAVSAQALEPRVRTPVPSLSFSGTTANCYVDYLSGSSSDSVSLTLTLYQGKTFVDCWRASGTGSAVVSGSCGVESGKSYTLTLTGIVNGSAIQASSTTRTCP